ncbi:hypothetical protein [Maridesulfovibrio sp.]|uniref:hypothetical protein n=1 Tax=Maridesulfovibrio sp. TaxID=2795000 RepID=UPI003BAA3FB4
MFNMYIENTAELSVTAERVSGDIWDATLPSLEGSTFFDRAQWQNAFKHKVSEIHYIHFRYKEKIIAGCACGITFDTTGRLLFKTPFTSAFGGVLAKPELSFSLLYESIGALRHYCAAVAKGENFEIQYVRRNRCSRGGDINESEDFALLHWGFSLNIMQCEFFINLSNDIFLTKRYASMIRKMNRENTFSFEPSTPDEFIVARDTIVKQQGKCITVPDEEIQKGCSLFPANILAYKAVRNDETVAVLLTDRINEHCCIGRNWFVDKVAVKNNATLFLLWQWINLVKEEKFKFAGFGSSANTKNALNKGTIFFKERFGPLIHDSRKTYRLVFDKQGA